MTENNALITPDLLELMASRICHDLISPVGAINNGVEFLQEMEGQIESDAIDLIAMSATAAAARLQVFRFVYGSGGKDPSVKPEDVHTTFEGFFSVEGKVKQNWDPFGDLGFEDRPEGFCKVLAGVISLVAECLPRGGELVVRSGDRPECAHIVASGAGVQLRPKTEEALKGTLNQEDLDPRLVHPYVLGILSRHYNFSVVIESQDESQITLSMASSV